MEANFTVHCISWHAAASLLQDVRTVARTMGLIDRIDAQTDSIDEHVFHALALSKEGNAIGCARITSEGNIERIVVLPNESRVQIEAAMKEVLNARMKHA